MTSCITLSGPDEGRAYLECDGCGARHTRRHYSITATREHAGERGWRVGTREDRTDWCAECISRATALYSEPVTLFDLMDTETTA